MKKALFISALVLMAAPALACAEHEAMNHAAGIQPAAGEEAAPATPPANLYGASMEKMHQGMMSVAPTGNPDADFVLNMIPHHEGAVDMAKVQLEHGTDPELRKLAEDIIAAQDKEIAFMKAWLEKHPR